MTLIEFVVFPHIMYVRGESSSWQGEGHKQAKLHVSGWILLLVAVFLKQPMITFL